MMAPPPRPRRGARPPWPPSRSFSPWRENGGWSWAHRGRLGRLLGLAGVCVCVLGCWLCWLVWLLRCWCSRKGTTQPHHCSRIHNANTTLLFRLPQDDDVEVVSIRGSSDDTPPGASQPHDDAAAEAASSPLSHSSGASTITLSSGSPLPFPSSPSTAPVAVVPAAAVSSSSPSSLTQDFGDHGDEELSVYEILTSDDDNHDDDESSGQGDPEVAFPVPKRPRMSGPAAPPSPPITPGRHRRRPREEQPAVVAIKPAAAAASASAGPHGVPTLAARRAELVALSRPLAACPPALAMFPEVPEVWEILVQRERQYLANPWCLEAQLNVQSRMRAVLLDWLIEVRLLLCIHMTVICSTLNLPLTP